MPNITISGVSRCDAQDIAEDVGNIVSKDSETDLMHIKVFYSSLERIDGEENLSIDIYWMPRKQEICDKVSRSLTEYLRKRAYSKIQITFTEFKGSLFYLDGKHF